MGFVKLSCRATALRGRGGARGLRARFVDIRYSASIMFECAFTVRASIFSGSSAGGEYCSMHILFHLLMLLHMLSPNSRSLGKKRTPAAKSGEMMNAMKPICVRACSP